MAGNRNSSDSSGFTLVSRRKARAASATVRPKGVESSERYNGPSVEEVVRKVHSYRQSIQTTQLHKEIISQLTCSKYKEVICYGIGHIGTCSIAQQQFGLLLALTDLCPPDTVFSLYDPVLYAEEHIAVERCGCTLRPSNEMCKHRTDQPTLYYMPHCGRAMYNNLLWSNWNTTILPLVTIIGNRFTSYQERLPTKKLFEETPYICKILPFCTEFSIPNSYHDNTVFNDLAIHTFPNDKLSLAQTELWTDNQEPNIDPNDPEIIVS